MKSSPLVSVIIPCYNQGQFLADAIESVLTQCYRRHEVIVEVTSRRRRRLNEIMGPDGRIVGEASDAVTLFGVPAFIYRNLLAGGLGLLSSTLLGQQAASLRHRNGLWYLIGYIGNRYEQNASRRRRSGISEIGTCVKALLRKKRNRNR